MAKHRVKCPYCGKTFIREDIENVPYKNRYYHVDCFEKKKIELEEEQDRINQREHLYEYLKEKYGQEKLSSKLVIQINKLMKTYGYSYSGIEKSLIYFYEVKNNIFNKNKETIMIVPWVYDDARKYFYGIFQAQQSNLQTEIPEENKKSILIHRPKVKNRIKFVDLDELLEEVENGKQ